MVKAWRSFVRFLGAIWLRVGDGHFGLIAAGVAFYAMFAVFPGLAAVVAIWSLMADRQVITGYLEVAERFLPPEAGALIHDQVMGLLNAPATTLGWATFVSLMLALYSARNGVAALVQGLDVVHRATPRSWVKGWLVDLGLTLLLIGALIIALATVVIVPVLFDYVSLGKYESSFLRILPWIAMFVLVLSCLSILYHYGPNVAPDARAGWISYGVIFAALAWAGVSLGFSTYLSNFNSYNRIYGSIGAVIILMTWLYLSVWAILVGGAINAELDDRSRLFRSMGRARRN
ncbi:YihY/virulence factor BrkB family protein [Xinfangfangia sp. CPCC 101601]|uniref:YihY/virulence factor BrkB family protein n=1 Tax=Pseudogemmobacter lacusdianii TaxID=3069608 RepID=A0ABU0VU65_9RHOB|nr:YihY/virulence factor BrkB family protein [Xinfangfangia sp. CPCC 101601]MDQ2065253.1 YihY/virulence factor BrkB family protein [Xinfangfangia sp. CPCC 101601]